jgi:RNA polymerase sigma-70 factor (ECF subfamily)
MEEPGPLVPSADTHELVRAAASGDDHAWSQLFRRHRVLMRALVHARIPGELRSRFETDDVLQSAFLLAYRQIDTFEQRGPAAFKRWLATIVANKLNEKIRYHRRQRRNTQREGPRPDAQDVAHIETDGDSPSTIVVRAETLAEVLAAIDTLSEEDQAYVGMRFFENLAWVEIAASMQVPEATARRRAHEALERLVRKLM